MSDPIIEVKAALEIALNWADENDDRYIFSDALAALPLIRVQVLEEAAKVADLYTKKEMPWPSHETAHVIAGRIRALKEQP